MRIEIRMKNRDEFIVQNNDLTIDTIVNAIWGEKGKPINTTTNWYDGKNKEILILNTNEISSVKALEIKE